MAVHRKILARIKYVNMRQTRHELMTPKTRQRSPTRLLAKQTAHTLENTILLRVVWVVFAGNFENGGEGVGEGVYNVADAFRNLE